MHKPKNVRGAVRTAETVKQNGYLLSVFWLFVPKRLQKIPIAQYETFFVKSVVVYTAKQSRKKCLNMVVSKKKRWAKFALHRFGSQAARLAYPLLAKSAIECGKKRFDTRLGDVGVATYTKTAIYLFGGYFDVRDRFGAAFVST